MTYQVGQQVLARLTLVPMMMAAVPGIVRFRQLPLNTRWLVALLGFVLLLNTLGFALLLLHHSNLFLMPVYAVGELALLALLALQVQRLGQEPMFRGSAGLLIYLLSYLQIALFSNYLLRYSRHLTSSVWSVHSLLFIVLYACYCRTLWLTPPK